MVLEARQRPRNAWIELGFQEDVPDHPPLAGHGVVGEKADPRELGARPVAVEAAEELVAAADGEERGSRVHRLDQRRPLRGEIGRDESLFVVLAAADVVEVVLAGPNLVSEADRPVVELDAPPGGPALEDRDVAAIGVDVQVLRIEVPDDEFHATASSQ